MSQLAEYCRKKLAEAAKFRNSASGPASPLQVQQDHSDDPIVLTLDISKFMNDIEGNRLLACMAVVFE